MPYNLKHWQSQVRDWWAEHGPSLEAAPIESAYALLATSAWLPFLAAYAQDPGPATTALVTITAGIGSNLVANLVQNIYDRARGGDQVTAQAREDAQTHQEVDAVIQATRVLEAAQEALGERWDEFARQLTQELAFLPGHSTLTVGGSAIAGDVTLTGGSTYVGGDRISIEAETVQFGAPFTAQPPPASEPSPPPAEPPSPEALRDRYLRELVGRCAHLKMTTIDRKAATRQEAAQLDLAAVFTDLDIHDVGMVESEARERGEPIRDGSTDRRRPVLAALSRFSSRLVLLGNPGSGKSTLVNFVTLCLAGDWLNAPDANLHRLGEFWHLPRLLPIHVILRDYAARGLPQDKGLWEFIGDELARIETHDGSLGDCLPVLRSYLERESGAILFLDGVDEVPDAHRYRLRLKEAVEQFARDFPHCRILVTSRPYAYQDADAYLANFDVRTLAPFTPEQAQTFIHRWYEHVGLRDPALGPENAARYADQLARAVETNPRLADLAPNPLLLTLMASLHRWQEGGGLPEKRQELYEQSVQLLLDLWQRPKQLFDAQGNPAGEEYDVFTELGISQDNLRAALNLVAYETHRDQPALSGTHDIRARDLAGAFYVASTNKGKAQGEDRILQYLTNRAGLLIERKQEEIYAFPHRTFQEYMAACHMADDPYLLAERLREDDARWREAALLAAAKAVSGSTFAMWTMISVFCPHDWPPPKTPTDSDWYAALRAAEALLETEQHLRVPRRQQCLLERLSAWLVELVSSGHLPAPERAAAGRALAHLGDPRDLNELVFIPGGPFLMGSREDDEEAYDDEKPQHAVEVADFSISKYPVTNAQYARFIQAEGYDQPRCWTKIGWAWRTGAREPDLSVIEDEELRENYADWLAQRPPEKRDRPFWWDDPAWNLANHPVVGVSWFEALAYTRWLAEASGRPCRLPAEAEWEKAARGNLPLAGGDRGRARIYPWGNEWAEDYANTSEAGVGRTTSVGTFPAGASPDRVLDMSGNVWEWCSSLGKEYPYQNDDGREDLETGGYRVLRGGSWYDNRRGARCAYRSDDHPDDFNDSVGFRVVFPGSLPSDS